MDYMSVTMIVAVVLITLALVLYTIGVFAERIAKRLKKWHLLFFWSGLVCDTVATGIMMEGSASLFSVHGITGVVAIGLMLLHAVWASAVLAINSQRAIENFHRFSLGVWIIWLISYLTGFVGSMR